MSEPIKFPFVDNSDDDLLDADAQVETKVIVTYNFNILSLLINSNKNETDN